MKKKENIYFKNGNVWNLQHSFALVKDTNVFQFCLFKFLFMMDMNMFFFVYKKLKIKSIKTILTTNFDIVGEMANEFDPQVTIPFFLFCLQCFISLCFLREMTLKNKTASCFQLNTHPEINCGPILTTCQTVLVFQETYGHRSESICRSWNNFLKKYLIFLHA